MHDLIAFFQTNAALVIGNPITFATFSVLFGSGGFVAGRYFLTERIANLESRIIRRDEEIAALETGGREKAEEPSLIPIIGTSVIESDATPLLGKWPDRRQSGKLSAPPRQRRA